MTLHSKFNGYAFFSLSIKENLKPILSRRRLWPFLESLAPSAPQQHSLAIFFAKTMLFWHLIRSVLHFGAASFCARWRSFAILPLSGHTSPTCSHKHPHLV